MKIKRNEKCTCGSGKKFKKCCWKPQVLVPAQIPPLPMVEKKTKPHLNIGTNKRIAMVAMTAALLGSHK